MIQNILIEIVLAVVMSIFGRQLWIAFKRDQFLKSRITNQEFLQLFLTKEALENPSPDVTIYATPNELGYSINIHAVNVADVASTQRIKLFYAILLMIIFIASYYLGVIYLVINVVVFLVTALSPISTPAKFSALQHVMTLAYILRCWHKENPAECEQWIEQAWALRPLYEAVKKTS